MSPSKPAPPPNDPPHVLARIREGMDLVDLCARQMCKRIGHRITLEEIASYGHEGLIAAARSFKEDRGVPFLRWANLRIRGAMIDGVRAQTDLPRHVYRRLTALEAGDAVQETLLEDDAAAPATSAQDADHRLGLYLRGIATAMAIGVVGESRGVELDNVVDRAPTPEEEVARAEMVHAIKEVVGTRPKEEQKLIVRHYFEGATFEEAARELGLSKSWASRLHTRAIEAIGKELERRFASARE